MTARDLISQSIVPFSQFLARKSANPLFANKIFANETLANGESPVYFRQHTLSTLDSWRECTRLSPVYPLDLRQLASIHCTLANILFTLSPNRTQPPLGVVTFVYLIAVLAIETRTPAYLFYLLSEMNTLSSKLAKVHSSLLNLLEDIHQLVTVSYTLANALLILSPIGECLPYFRHSTKGL